MDSIDNLYNSLFERSHNNQLNNGGTQLKKKSKRQSKG